jgi:ribosomal-protein-alanine N-acetyltransferase
MKLIPIRPEKRDNSMFLDNPQQADIIDAFAATYQKKGYEVPWIGYMIYKDEQIVGCGGFKGKPIDDVVEIAYGTFEGFEGRQIATEICKVLVNVALKEDSNLKVRARTLPEKGASTRILEKNGFDLLGNVNDEDDGVVWEWEYKNTLRA